MNKTIPDHLQLHFPNFTMPKSKRDKKISLTRTEKKPGLETKAALVEKVRGAVDNYARIFVFQVHSIWIFSWWTSFSLRLKTWGITNWRLFERSGVTASSSSGRTGCWAKLLEEVRRRSTHRVWAWWPGRIQLVSFFGLVNILLALCRCLRNECGLLATNQSRDEVIIFLLGRLQLQLHTNCEILFR